MTSTLLTSCTALLPLCITSTPSPEHCARCQDVDAYTSLSSVNRRPAPQVDVDYSDADKRAVLRFFTALAELISRQPSARVALVADRTFSRHQVSCDAEHS